MASSTLVSIDFRDTAPEQATVSIFDHGFLFGDSVYEVVRTWKGRMLFAQDHFERLASSAAGIGLPLPHSAERYLAEFERLHAKSGNPESYVRLIVTRGVGELELHTRSCRHQTSIVILKPLKTWPSAMYTEGATLALVDVLRNSRESTPPAYKTGNYLNSMLAIERAAQWDATESLMLNKEGHVTECTTSNVFWVRDGEVFTPALEVGILSGVTRRHVIEACSAIGIRVRQGQYAAQELLDANEVFITSTTRDVMPITRINDRKVGAGRPGATTRRIMEAFASACDRAVAD